MNPKKLDLVIRRGSTFLYELRWETEPIVYKEITLIEKTAPVRITAVGHGMKTGQRGVVTNAKGMVEINAEANNIRESDYHQVTVIDTDKIEFNDTNAAGFKAYVSGGILQYNTAPDLAGVDFRMSIKDKVGGVELLSLTSDNGRILVDESNRVFTLLLPATEAALIEWGKGVYDIEAQQPSGIVTPLYQGKVTIDAEVTTTP